MLSELRNDASKSLTKIAHERRISPNTVVRHTNAFRKVKGRWIAKKDDRIPRSMLIYENGRESSIEVTSSQTSSLIGEYHNAVKQYLNTGDIGSLKRFERKKIKDALGKSHKFETSIEAITKINEAIEEPEFYEIYSP